MFVTVSLSFSGLLKNVYICSEIKILPLKESGIAMWCDAKLKEASFGSLRISHSLKNKFRTESILFPMKR